MGGPRGGRLGRGKAGCTSRFRGVSWEWRRADGRNWHAQLWHNNKARCCAPTCGKHTALWHLMHSKFPRKGSAWVQGGAALVPPELEGFMA